MILYNIRLDFILLPLSHKEKINVQLENNLFLKKKRKYNGCEFSIKRNYRSIGECEGRLII